MDECHRHPWRLPARHYSHASEKGGTAPRGDSSSSLRQVPLRLLLQIPRKVDRVLRPPPVDRGRFPSAPGACRGRPSPPSANDCKRGREPGEPSAYAPSRAAAFSPWTPAGGEKVFLFAPVGENLPACASEAHALFSGALPSVAADPAFSSERHKGGRRLLFRAPPVDHLKSLVVFSSAQTSPSA